MTGPRPKGLPWESDDDRKLLEWSSSGVDEAVIARKLRRTRSAVRTRKVRLRQAPTGTEISRLQKFVEQGTGGECPGRTAYTFNGSLLPEPTRGFDWRPVAGFSVSDEILKDAGLKKVFKAAILYGYAIIGPAGYGFSPS